MAAAVSYDHRLLPLHRYYHQHPNRAVPSMGAAAMAVAAASAATVAVAQLTDTVIALVAARAAEAVSCRVLRVAAAVPSLVAVVPSFDGDGALEAAVPYAYWVLEHRRTVDAVDPHAKVDSERPADVPQRNRAVRLLSLF